MYAPSGTCYRRTPYFIAEARYRGELTKDEPWTGQVAWADKLTPQTRQIVLERLKLPATTGPDTWWLTEFEDELLNTEEFANVPEARVMGEHLVQKKGAGHHLSPPFSCKNTSCENSSSVHIPCISRNASATYRLTKRLPNYRLTEEFLTAAWYLRQGMNSSIALLRRRYGGRIAELNCTRWSGFGELSRTRGCRTSRAPAPVTILRAGL
jgi:hypothetical protein